MSQTLVRNHFITQRPSLNENLYGLPCDMQKKKSVKHVSSSSDIIFNYFNRHRALTSPTYCIPLI